jgi:hypothetical protein
MSNRRMTALGVSLLVCYWLAAQAAAPLLAQPKDSAGESDKNTVSAEEKALNLRYANAYLALLEVTLAKYEDMNRAAPNTIRPTVIQAIKNAVSDARSHLAQTESDEKNASEIYVKTAEARLQVSEDILKRSEAAVARNANAISPQEIARLKAARDLDKVKVEKARHLALESPLSNLQFEVTQLHEDVQELRMAVAILQSKN